MGPRLLAWWESLQGRTRVLAAIPVAWIFLFMFHQMFPLLSNAERALYATMEAVPIALLVAWATENELRRRREREARGASSEDPPDGE